MEPFLGEESIVSVIDLDGVLCEFGRRNNLDNNISRFLGLKNIISKSKEFVVYSSRIELNEDSGMWKMLKPVFGDTSIARCPFMVKSSIDRLENFAQKANPDCSVEFKVGFKKIRSCFGEVDDFSTLVEKTLEQNKKLVMVGSSFFDRQIIKQAEKETAKKGLNTKNIYFFDTGHWIV